MVFDRALDGGGCYVDILYERLTKKTVGTIFYTLLIRGDCLGEVLVIRSSIIVYVYYNK